MQTWPRCFLSQKLAGFPFPDEPVATPEPARGSPAAWLRESPVTSPAGVRERAVATAGRPRVPPAGRSGSLLCSGLLPPVS